MDNQIQTQHDDTHPDEITVSPLATDNRGREDLIKGFGHAPIVDGAGGVGYPTLGVTNDGMKNESFKASSQEVFYAWQNIYFSAPIKKSDKILY